jgi:hypothetical protein
MLLQVLLEEWNNSAILVVFAIISVPIILLQLLINFILRIFPKPSQWLEEQREKKMAVYVGVQFFLFIICTCIVLGLGALLQ